MAKEVLPVVKTRARRKAERQLDLLLDERQILRARQDDENFRCDETIALAKRQRDDALLGAQRRIDEIDEEAAAYVRGRLRWLLGWFSKTMVRPSGRITVVNQAATLEMPGDVGLVTDLLEKIPGGDAYIRTIKEPDRQGLLKAPSEIIEALAPAGVRREAHDTISIRSLSDTKAKQIARWRAKPRTRRSTPN